MMNKSIEIISQYQSINYQDYSAMSLIWTPLTL